MSSGVDAGTWWRYLLAGADGVMTASALLRHDSDYAGVLLNGLSDWMQPKGFSTIDALRGMLSVPSHADSTAHEGAGYVSSMRQANSSTYGPW